MNAKNSFLAAVGANVRVHRKQSQLTIAELAETAELSPRFISQLEGGSANIAIGRLRQVAAALSISLEQLLQTESSAHSSTRTAVNQIVARLNETQLEHALHFLREHNFSTKSGGIALVGMRGSGKSTLGAAISERLGLPFVELAEDIQKNAGLDLAEIFELHGPDYYRSLVRAALNQRLADSGQAILALPGGIVTDDQAWNLVRRNFSTVWLHAKAIDLLERVANQGDQRPMDASEDAMSDLERMMAGRELGYRQAEIQIDTSSTPLDQLESLLASCLAEIGWEGSQAGYVP